MKLTKILAIILPDRLYYRLMQYERYLYFAVLLLIFTGALDKPITYARFYIYNAFDSITLLPFKFLG